MAFTPTNTLLGSVNEFQSILFTIRYSSSSGGGIGGNGNSVSQPVTITANQPSANVIISGNNITGFFSDSFDNIISYRTNQDTFVQVNKFTDINTDELYGIYHFDADNRVQIPYTFTASVPSGETQIYTIIVLHNFTPNRNQLVKYTNVEVYETSLRVLFNNNNNDNVNWNNTLSQIINWENNTWPIT